MTNRELFKRAPNTALTIAATVVVLAIIAAFTLITLGGRDSSGLRDLLQTLGSVLGAVAGAGGLAYASSAARSSAATQQQTNGSLDARMRAAAAEAYADQRADLLGMLRRVAAAQALVDQVPVPEGQAAAHPARPDSSTAA